MATLISITAFVKDSTTLSPSTNYAIPTEHIKFAVAATANQQHAYPAASQGIITAVHTNEPDNNSGENHVYLVNNTVASIVSAS